VHCVAYVLNTVQTLTFLYPVALSEIGVRLSGPMVF
jgi:hypothetical protein